MFVYKKAMVLFLLVWAGILSTHPDLVFSIHQPQQIQILESQDWEPIPTKIIFDESVSLPIQEEDIIDGNWNIAETAVSHLSSSSNPGKPGNIILYAHNYPEMFGYLKNVRLRDTFTLQTTGGTNFSYRVISKIVVDSNQIEWLASTDTEVVTLYTCDGWRDEKRLVVRAVPVVGM